MPADTTGVITILEFGDDLLPSDEDSDFYISRFLFFHGRSADPTIPFRQHTACISFDDLAAAYSSETSPVVYVAGVATVSLVSVYEWDSVKAILYFVARLNDDENWPLLGWQIENRRRGDGWRQRTGVSKYPAPSVVPCSVGAHLIVGR